MATNVAHLSNRWKADWKKEEENTDGSVKAKENKRMRTNALAWSSLAFFPFFLSLFIRSNNVCVCLCEWTSVPLLRIAYKKHKLIPLRIYSKMITCASKCWLCVCLPLVVGASPAVIRSLGTTPPVCLCSFLITAHSTGNGDKNGLRASGSNLQVLFSKSAEVLLMIVGQRCEMWRSVLSPSDLPVGG